MTIELVEVAPRDGLQNEMAILSSRDKVDLVERAIAAGARRIEVASFVNAARVPQMADAETVVAALPRSGARYIGLVLNKRGALRAFATDIDELGLVCVASDVFGERNQGQTSEQSLQMAVECLALAKSQGRAAQAMIAVAWGCPFSGKTDPERVIAMARTLADAGSFEIGLADTIGIARPYEVAALVEKVRAAVSPLPVRVHLHDTRGMGVANAMAALSSGAMILDASIGGTGGCPFAPGSAGNVATEDLLYALGEAGSVNLPKTIETAHWLSAKLGRTCTSAVARASA